VSYEELRQQHLTALAYKHAVDMHGVSPTLIKVMDTDGNLATELGLPDLSDTQQVHETITENFSPDAMREMALESLLTKLAGLLAKAPKFIAKGMVDQLKGFVFGKAFGMLAGLAITSAMKIKRSMKKNSPVYSFDTCRKALAIYTEVSKLLKDIAGAYPTVSQDAPWDKIQAKIDSDFEKKIDKLSADLDPLLEVQPGPYDHSGWDELHFVNSAQTASKAAEVFGKSLEVWTKNGRLTQALINRFGDDQMKTADQINKVTQFYNKAFELGHKADTLVDKILVGVSHHYEPVEAPKK
jgi:hypothetical protein